MTDLNDLRDDAPSKLSRRRVVAGTAWAVPIVMGVGAAPAWAVSTVVSVTASMSGNVLTFTIATTGAAPTDTVTILSVGGNTPILVWANPWQPTSLASNTATINNTTSTNGNGKKTYIVTYQVTGRAQATVSFVY